LLNISSGRPFLLFADCMNLMSPTPRALAPRPPWRRAPIPRVCDGDNIDDGSGYRQPFMAGGGAVHKGFGEFHGDPRGRSSPVTRSSCRGPEPSLRPATGVRAGNIKVFFTLSRIIVAVSQPRPHAAIPPQHAQRLLFDFSSRAHRQYGGCDRSLHVRTRP